MIKLKFRYFVFIFLFIFASDALPANKGKRKAPTHRSSIERASSKPSERLQASTPSRDTATARPSADFSKHNDHISDLHRFIASHMDFVKSSQGTRTKRQTPLNLDVLLDRIRLTENESQQDMTKQGYTPEYVASLDTVKDSLNLAHLLRQRFISYSGNPENVHIPEFARLIDSHIDFVQRGLRSQDSSDSRNLRLNQLEQLRHEARIAQETNQVTYRWSLNFTLQLAILATHPEHLNARLGYFITTNIDKHKPDYTNLYDLTRTRLETLLGQQHPFPKVIIIPTIETSKSIGIIPENRIYGTGVHILGLTNRFTSADNTDNPTDPLLFLGLDMFHTGDAHVDMSPFVNLFIHKLQGLPKPQRERIELVFYKLTREFSYRFSTVEEPLQQILDIALAIDFENYTESEFLQFMPNRNPTYNDVSAFIQQARAEFVTLFNETRALVVLLKT